VDRRGTGRPQSLSFKSGEAGWVSIKGGLKYDGMKAVKVLTPRLASLNGKFDLLFGGGERSVHRHEW